MFVALDQIDMIFSGPFATEETANEWVNNMTRWRTNYERIHYQVLPLLEVDKVVKDKFRRPDEKDERPIIIHMKLGDNNIVFGLINNVDEGEFWITLHRRDNPAVKNNRSFWMYYLDIPR